MTTLAQQQVVRPEDAFQDFFRSYPVDEESKYRKRLAQIAVSEGRSLVVDFEDLISFDPDLARKLVTKPDEYLRYAESAAISQMKVEDPEYAEQVGRLFVRFRRLPEKKALRKIGAEHLNQMVLVDGIIVRVTQVKPMIVKAKFQCRKCLEIIAEEQEGDLMSGPAGAICPMCKQRSAFKLLEDESVFKNTQEARIQERPEDLPPGQLPRYMDVRLEVDMVDFARPGDRVGITALVRAQREYYGEKGKLRTFTLYFDANYMDVVGKETEVVEITAEDEKKILEAAADPWIHRNLISSLAPSIYGYDDIKEGVLYLLFGGVPKHLPDGINIRGDSNTLIIGDPGCLVGDERIILGNGTTAKIEELGQEHMQEIGVDVLTGLGGGHRERANRFHIYRNQPTMEVVTESGKSVRGTYNHPLLTVEKSFGKLERRWKRMDELKVGDRLVIATSYSCTKTGLVRTGWKPLPYGRGPRFRGCLPSEVTPALGALLGYILGDGWVRRYQTGFIVADGEKDILPLLCGISRELFGISPHVETRKPGRGRQVTIHSVLMHSQDIAYNLDFLRQKRVPSLILKSGNQVLSAFLKWLYEADGTVFSQKRGCGAIGLKAKDIELLRDVQVLLLRFGIHSRIISNALLIRRGESILKYAANIGFASRKKTARLSGLTERARRIQRFNKQRSERIVKVIEREPADVYDIEVPKSHRFIANGIISHNTAKSQLLQYVSRIAPRGLYTSGRGTTAAGLTAAVLREKTGGMVLEAGAMVLADKGVACIDELDKMRPDDRVAIHEALEQQTVSVAKGGIVATLNARAAVLAAANPSLGRYEPHRNVSENINLPVTILSRFDLIFILKDMPEQEADSRMSTHILTLHKTLSNPEAPFPPDFLKKYISYAKRINPALGPDAVKELHEFYLKMRAKSGGADAAIAITPRQLEALIRLSESRARSFLRKDVTVEDAKSAIRIMTVSLSDVGIDVKTGSMDIDVIMTGKPRSVRDILQKVIEIVSELEKETGTVEESLLVQVLVEREKIEEREARRSIGQLVKEGVLYSPKPGRLKRTSG